MRSFGGASSASVPSVLQLLTGVNENVGNSTYHSLQVKAEHRSSKGLWFLATYTFSKLLTDSDYIQASSLANGNLALPASSRLSSAVGTRLFRSMTFRIPSTFPPSTNCHSEKESDSLTPVGRWTG